MEPITSSDIVGEELGNKRLSSLSLSADAVAEKLNDVARYVDTTFAQLSDPGIEQLKVTEKLELSSGEFSMRDSSDTVKNFNIKGGYLEGSCGKYTKAKGKMGREDASTASKYWYEPMCVGAKCYCVLSAWNDEELNGGKGMLKLSGDVSGLEELLALPDSNGCRWSLGLYNLNNAGTHTVVGLHDAGDGVKYVKLGQTLDLQKAGIVDAAGNFVNGFDRGEERYLEIWNEGLKDEDDNCFYCPTWPEAGNQVSPFMKYAHAEGVASRALQRFDHVEGRKNIVDGRYSHGEGDENILYGYASHVEGYSNKARAASVSHIEGDRNKIDNILYCHIEGSSQNVKNAQDVHVEGANNVLNPTCELVTGSGHIAGSSLSVDGCGGFNITGRYNSMLSSDLVEVHGTGIDVAKEYHSFIWSGKYLSDADRADHTKYYGYAEDKDGNRVGKFGNGAFAINPVNGTKGFYIGTETLSAIIDNAIAAAFKAKGL